MSKMTLKAKLYMSYGALALLALTTSVLSIVILSQLKSTVHEITRVNIAKQSDSSTIRSTASDQMYLVNGAMLRVAFNDAAMAQANMDEFRKNAELLRSTLDDYKALMTTDEEKADYRQLTDILNNSDQQMKDFEAMVRQGKIDAAWPYYKDSLRKPLTDIHDAAQKMALYEQMNSTSMGADAASRILTVNWIFCLLLLPNVLAGAVILMTIRKLDAQLRRSIAELTDGSEQVASAAMQVSSSSQMLARDTSEQAAMIEETSASTEEINSMARRNAEHSKTAAVQMAELKLLMDSGSREMETATQAMDDISQSSDKISRIIQVIEKIAFQTNILALNAAVEAARAGEAGKGFAVVADEVRNLAQQCAQAAQDTGVLIEQSQQTSKAGHLRVQRVAEETHKMSLVLDGMKELVDEINGGSQEQGRGIDQIGRAITQMEQGTQKSAANAEESAAAAEQLTAQSNVLRDVAAQLGTMVGSSEDAAVRRPAVKKLPVPRSRNSGFSSPKVTVRTASIKSFQHGAARARVGSHTGLAATNEAQFPLEEAEFAEF